MYAHVAVDDGSSRTFRIEGCRDVVPVDPACFVVVTHRFIGAEVLFADEIEVRLREARTHLHCRRSRARAQFDLFGQVRFRNDLAVRVQRYDHSRFGEARRTGHARVSGKFIVTLCEVFHLAVFVGDGFDYGIRRGIEDDHRIAPSGEDLAAREDHAGLGRPRLRESTECSRNVARADDVGLKVHDADARMRFVVGRGVLDIGLFGTYDHDVLRPAEGRF